MSKAHDIGLVIRDVLLEHAEEAKGKRAVVALSGGVDSCACLASLMEVGHEDILLVSYTPDTHESTDFKMSRQTAVNLELPFVPAVVNMSAEALEEYVRTILRMGYNSKIQVESLSPMLRICQEAAGHGGEVLFTGDQSDGYFALSRFATIASNKRTGYDSGDITDSVRKDETSDRIDEIRRWYFKKDASCSGAVAEIADESGMDACFPFRDERILEAFLGSTWREVNKPRVKEPIKIAFQDWFDRNWIQTRNVQVNLHKGDSRFGNTMGETLLAQPHLQGKWKSAIGLYRAMDRGEV